METDSAIFNVTEVTMPTYSIGECKNWRNCKSFQVDLGNGICVDCWDRGFEKICDRREARRKENSLMVDYYLSQRKGKKRYGTNAVGRL